MEKFVGKMANKIATNLKYDDEQRAVIQYGLYAILQIIITAIFILLIGFFTHSLWECIIVYISVALLRKSTGGAHAKTSNGCLVVSIIAVSALSIISRYFTFFQYGYIIGFVLSPVFFLVSCLIIYKLAPVGTENKPLNSPEKIKRLRKQSFITLIFYACILAGMLILSIYYDRALNLAFSLGVATLWQALTLVKAVKK
ncbi:MAG: accessory gene regulator B family protein [Oscillospiraceae bacterium]|mgnify:FL=1|jgi:accessory gene regulator B|nr:accessory gene regulator B family protein [Oscillospiraceae bacterium]MDD4546741.1 accessory gene regulator B family protein [Oscillospiraceae bacterium]